MNGPVLALAAAAGVAGSALRAALGGGRPEPFVAFALAAALGTLLRLRLMARWPHGAGVVAANVGGTALFAAFWKFTPLAVDTAPVLLAGFCGALTTFSGFAAELHRRVVRKAFGGAAWHLLAPVAAAGAALAWIAGSEVEPPAPAFPWGTSAANALGCALFGLLSPRISDGRRRAVLLGGFLGGLTTFSAWAMETHQLWCSGQRLAAVAYSAGSVAIGAALVGAFPRQAAREARP